MTGTFENSVALLLAFRMSCCDNVVECNNTTTAVTLDTTTSTCSSNGMDHHYNDKNSKSGGVLVRRSNNNNNNHEEKKEETTNKQQQPRLLRQQRRRQKRRQRYNTLPFSYLFVIDEENSEEERKVPYDNNNNNVAKMSLSPITVKLFIMIGTILFLLIHLYLYHQIIVAKHHHHQQQHDSKVAIMMGQEYYHEATTDKSNNTITTHNNANTNNANHHHHHYLHPTELNRTLQPLRYPIDYMYYTIRINTWKRVDLLKVSLEHHIQCDGVVQIQIVWCIQQGYPAPKDLMEFIQHLESQYPNKTIQLEYHDINSLNERFHILGDDAKTLGIFSIDDDVLRPCDAIDTGFFKWTQNYHRMVGFDARIITAAADNHHHDNHNQSHHHHVDDTVEYQYGYLSTMRKLNSYSMSLTRYAFLHRDYLQWYYHDIYYNTAINKSYFVDLIQREKNCEDIAMSLYISSLTSGQPPLLADYWAIDWSMIKLYSPAGTISSGKNHKTTRDYCVQLFLQELRLLQNNNNSNNSDSQQQQQQDTGTTGLEKKDHHHHHHDDSSSTSNNLLLLQRATFVHRNSFSKDDHHHQNNRTIWWIDCGDRTHPSYYHSLFNSFKTQHTTKSTSNDRQWQFIQKFQNWSMLSLKEMQHEVLKMKQTTAFRPYVLGLIQDSEPWKQRFKHHDHNNSHSVDNEIE